MERNESLKLILWQRFITKSFTVRIIFAGTIVNRGLSSIWRL
jgi:hypothetical protein